MLDLAVPPAEEEPRLGVLDLGGLSQLGTVTMAVWGQLTVRVRTGPGSDVDSYWSDWKRVSLQSQGNVMRGQLEAPNHRFAQIEVGLRGDGAQVSELSITHAPENLAPIVRKISVNAPTFDLSDNVAPPGRATASWSIDDVDGDDISYEVKLRGKGDSQWFKLTEGGGTTKTELTIDLDTLADGIYELEVIASDEPSNGSANARSDALVSDSFAIDRSAPRLDSLRQAKSTITGRAADALSPIHDVMYRIDDQPFRPASAQDGVFDELEEAFVLNLPELAPGRHRLVLRARDHAGNIKLEPMSVVVPEAEKSSSR